MSAGGGDTLGAVVFAAGGTGGHLTPMLAVAEALRSDAPDLRTVFLCSEREIDARVLEPAGEVWKPLPAKPLQANPWKLARFVTSWGPSVRATRQAIAQLRRDLDALDAPRRIEMVTTGGFVAAPAVQAARVERVPVTLVNLDAKPGKASRWIAPRAARVLTALPVDGGAWTRIPPIVRPGAGFEGASEDARVELGLDPCRPVLLITGGSQGARTLNDFILALAQHEPAAFEAWQVVHQCGSGDIAARARDAWRQAGVPAVVEAYFDRLGVAWRAAELAIARAGAGTVADAWRSATPTLFMPYPHHKDRHQFANAAPLVSAGGAAVLEDQRETPHNVRLHAQTVVALLRDTTARARMADELRKLGPTDGADRVARLLLAGGSTDAV